MMQKLEFYPHFEKKNLTEGKKNGRQAKATWALLASQSPTIPTNSW
jgi:hypothetical protein